MEIINFLLEEFNSDKRVDNSTSFEGCPSPIIRQIIQYRNEESQQEIWQLFFEIIEKGIAGLTPAHFASLKKWRGIDIASFTIFLFWINTSEFLPMDRNTVGFLQSFNIVDSRRRTYEEYKELCTVKLKFIVGGANTGDVFRNLVKDAYLYSDKSYTGDILSSSTHTIIAALGRLRTPNENLEVIAKRKQRDRVKGFQIIAIRPRIKEKRKDENDKQNHLKNLTEGQLYRFYKSYNFIDDNTIECSYLSFIYTKY